jgi:hypothetical protein
MAWLLCFVNCNRLKDSGRDEYKQSLWHAVCCVFSDWLSLVPYCHPKQLPNKTLALHTDYCNYRDKYLKTISKVLTRKGFIDKWQRRIAWLIKGWVIQAHTQKLSLIFCSSSFLSSPITVLPFRWSFILSREEFISIIWECKFSRLWLKITVFWDVTPSSLVDVLEWCTTSGFRVLLYLVDGGNMSLWNISKWLSNLRTANPRRQSSL